MQKVPYILEMQLKNLEILPNSTISTSGANSCVGLSFPDLPLCIDVEQLHHLDEGNSTTITLQDCHNIFKNTIGQAQNPLRKKERQLRLTASNFGKVINRKPE